MKILIIEDNEEINNLLGNILTEENYEVSRAFSGSEGILLFNMQRYDLVLLDLMLPGMKGEEVLDIIRGKSQVPVIIISAKTDIEDKINLLTNGANDYIAKPFDIREVLARVAIALKANRDVASSEVKEYDELSIDVSNRKFFVNNNEVVLTKLEFEIINLLISHPNKVYSKDELFELAWNDVYLGDDKTINVHISNIRKKIREYSEKEYIKTVWGIGFRL